MTRRLIVAIPILAYARSIARTLGDFLPGHPSIILRNMPGGGSRTFAAPCG